MGFLNPCFYSQEILDFYIKRRKSCFHDLFSRSFTWGYRGLQVVIGVASGYKGGYKGLQGLRRSYRALQRIKENLISI